MLLFDNQRIAIDHPKQGPRPGANDYFTHADAKQPLIKLIRRINRTKAKTITFWRPIELQSETTTCRAKDDTQH
jgi:hypothetical protein